MSMYPPITPFTRLAVTTLNVTSAPRLLASTNVIDGLARGRNGVELVNTSSVTVYIGADNVSPSNGIPIAAGERRYFPVTLGASKALYIAGAQNASVVLAEYFA